MARWSDFTSASIILLPAMLSGGDEMDDVEDQRHVAVTENRRAGEGGDVVVELRHRFDDGLVVADDLIDDEADALAAGRDNNHFLVRIGLRAGPEEFAQTQERHEIVTQRDEAAAARAQILLDRQFQAFLDSGEWDDIAPVADTNEETVDDGERQGNAQGDFGALAKLTADVDRSA